MRCGRATVLFLALILAGALAASVVPWPISAAVPGCLEPAESGLAPAGAATPAPGGDATAAVEALPRGGWGLRAPGASRFAGVPLAAPSPGCDPLGAHSGRAPPLA